jgi:predicted dienelactone hydrolase
MTGGNIGFTQEARREPNTVEQSRQMAAEGRARVFVIFLDTYHTTIEGSSNMRLPLIKFLDRLLGPDDMVALMTPEKRRQLKPRDVVLDAVTDTQGWQERPRDVSFVLDSLDDLERRVPQLAGTIDRTRIGAAGHSYGAMTTTILAGASIRTKVGGDLVSLADPRIKAAIVLSGQGEGQMGFGEGSWTNLKIPLLVMTGSKDRGARGQDPMWRKAPFANSPAGEKYWTFIDGATHMSFAGRDSNNAIVSVIERTTQTFWDAQLKDDEAAKQSLNSGKVVKDAGVDVQFEQR